MITRARLKFLRSLRRRKVREQEGLLLLEGLNVVEEAAAFGRVREVYLADDAAASPRGKALLDRGLHAVRLAPADVDALAMTRTPAGAFALAESPCAPLDAGAIRDVDLLLLAAGVADPGNLGTLVRTAAALGAAAVVVAPGTVEPTNPKVVRATAGALYRVPVRSGDANALADAGCAILVADARGAPVTELAARPPRTVLAVGSEPHGVDASVRTRAAGTLAVPLRSGVESLNVAVAAGILLYTLGACPVAGR